jgi:hypothetical protein
VVFQSLLKYVNMIGLGFHIGSRVPKKPSNALLKEVFRAGLKSKYLIILPSMPSITRLVSQECSLASTAIQSPRKHGIDLGKRTNSIFQNFTVM